jgi:PAB1-binding protein PBP1
MPFGSHSSGRIIPIPTFIRTSRIILVAAAALAVAAPAASAKPMPPRVAVSSTSPQMYQGAYRPVDTNVAPSPDRGDRIGTINQVTGIHQLPAMSKTTASSSSFDWTAAALGAGSVLSAGLIGAGALGLRGRRRMALGV